ncbi:D-alanyl-D-alanine carboxypeptidase/endopeptidase [Endozoicomonas montiporae CL-33]|nr:D-alanyl-D-alanine carboxypeptidase/endopeptidase [Endozoicomonas montiporae CL-33]
MRRVIRLLTYLGFLCSMTAAAADSVVNRLESLISELPEGSVYSIQVRDPIKGNVLFEQGAHLNLIPASTLKVLTATLAYDALGQEFRYNTSIASENKVTRKGVVKGAVMLSFSGDPSLKREHLNDLVAQLKEKKITTIAGDLWLDGAVYSGYDRAGGVSWDDLNICFAAPAAAMILDRNCFYGWLKPGKKEGDPAIMEYDRPEWNLEVDNQVVTESLPEGERCTQKVRPSADFEYALQGCISPKSRPLRMAFSVSNVERAVERFMYDLLEQHDIQLKGRIIAGRPELNMPYILAEHHSEALPELLRPVLEDSDNLYSDSILKTVGHQTSGKTGSYASGIESARTLLGNKGVGFGSSRLVDGSGLSRYNFISAATLVDILMLGWKQWGEESPWLTQRKRKEQWFKTGYMSGVRSMAGYVFPDNGRPLVFAVILNGLMPPLPATDQEMRAFKQDIRAFHRSFLKVLGDSGKTLDISAK